ncbi:hypothetical protein ET495_08370 [Xylanimonas allomyrinae]|uniref:Single-stranded DNA-binding protein n=1 Tax=Xylanimonas allomyrinae TaxID=2509459 RepID=A0A4P6ELV6_9MICO|nr:single-stranded DNA-binding protein [Xylanimonas allomyrinae]QAY63256.1 hypothetical protein ET495_08370 [Xylanimonas allomyrinae]
MSIPTRQCIVGEIASAPHMSKTTDGGERYFARIKIKARRPRPDGTYGPPAETFHNLVAFGRAAQRARTRVREGDVIVAAGYVREYVHTVAGVERRDEEFVMRWFGHDAWRTTYRIARTGHHRSEAAARRTTAPAEVGYATLAEGLAAAAEDALHAGGAR